MSEFDVSARARTREDRAGDPLDGLVNLFDLGIVLSVAFLLAALSSLKLTDTVLNQKPSQAAPSQAQQASPGSVIAKPNETTRGIDLKQGERVVGQGEPVGTIYRLSDGRTIVVEPKDAPKPAAP